METYNSIEVTKQLVKDGKISQEIAETIFPELKESEDERIRKGLMEHLKELKEQSVEGSNLKRPEHYDAWIAWLEKQGEQNLANSAKTCKIEPKFKVKYAGGEYNVFETKELAGTIFFGIEDEPNHIDYVKAENCDEIISGYAIKENGAPYPTKPAVFSEQNPAWSEEDDINLGKAIWYVENPAPMVVKDSMLVEWLKSLQRKMHLEAE